jgi:hypothetical protein
VGAPKRPGLLKARDTVAGETSASRATSDTETGAAGLAGALGMKGSKMKSFHCNLNEFFL